MTHTLPDAPGSEQVKCANKARYERIWAHAGLFGAYVVFGITPIVIKLSYRGGNVAVYNLVRDAVSGPIMCLIAITSHPLSDSLPKLRDLRLFLSLAAALFATQMLFPVGVQMVDFVANSAWQLSLPVWTMVISVCAGFEKATFQKTSGVLLTVLGGAIMALCGADVKSQVVSTGYSPILGNLVVFFQVVAASSLTVFFKALRTRGYPGFVVLGWSYLPCSAMMFVAACVANNVPVVLAMFCADRDDDVKQHCIENPWQVSADMFWPLVFMIFGGTIFTYSLMSWALRFLPPTIAGLYGIVQPFMTVLFSGALILLFGADWANEKGLVGPGVQDLGAIAIFVGFMVVVAEADEGKRDQQNLKACPTVAPNGYRRLLG